MSDRVEDLGGAFEAPGAVGVEPERGAGIERAADGDDPRDVIVEADFCLHVAQADHPHLSRVLHRALDRPRRDDAAIGHAGPTDGQQRGQRLPGPAIVEQPDTTTVIPPGWVARVEDSGSLRIGRG